MKNLINYYYGIFINDFKKINDRFVFTYDNKNYEFIPFFGDINKFYENYVTLINNNKYCHEIIFNKDKNILTFYNNKPYLLLRKNINIDNKVDINEIINYDFQVYGNYSLNWKKLWMDKIDYYEYQMSQLGIKYKKLKSSFDYYVGLSENAINLLNYINDKNIKYYICHKRICANEKLDSFFNPLGIIVDSRVRDIAEYIKIMYFNKETDIDEVKYYLDILNLDDTEILLFLARMIYPSYYFDMYDQIIQENINEEKIEIYTKKNVSYETFLKKIYNHIKTKYEITQIEWLEN